MLPLGTRTIFPVLNQLLEKALSYSLMYRVGVTVPLSFNTAGTLLCARSPP